LEGQLLSAELAGKTGNHSAARDQLASVESRARAAGFGLIARRASADRQALQGTSGL
jgi:hypothetical protein